MGVIRALALCCAASPALSADLLCAGISGISTWTLEISDDAATFDFIGTSDMQVMLRTPVEGRQGAEVLSLVGRDTGVALLEPRACGDDPVTLTYLTQRTDTPLALHGCCTKP